MMKPRLCIIANENAGRFRREKKNLFSYFKYLEKLYETHLILVSERGEALRAAHAIRAEKEITNFLAVGGDGTAREVMCALLGQESCSLSLLPAGTANVFARDRGIPYSLKAHFRYMERNLRCVPLVFYPGEACSERASFPFVQMAGTGIDGAIVAHTPFSEKKRFGALAYFLQALRISKKFAQKKREFFIDHQKYEAYGLIALTNRFYAGSFSIGEKTPIPSDKMRFVLLSKKGMMGLVDLALYSVFYDWGLKSRTIKIIESERASFIVSKEDFTELDGDYCDDLLPKRDSIGISFQRSKKFIHLYCKKV